MIRAGLAFALFAILTAFVAGGALRDVDLRALEAIQTPQGRLLDLGASLVSLAGQAEITGSIALGVALARLRHRRRDWVVPLAIAAVVLIESILKTVVPQTPPPADRARSITLLPFLEVPFGNSFPSGHVARTAFLLVALRAPALLTVLGLAAMAVTRVYLADHWPSDVVGGLLLGAAVAWAVRIDVRFRSSSTAPGSRPRREPTHRGADGR